MTEPTQEQVENLKSRIADLEHSASLPRVEEIQLIYKIHGLELVMSDALNYLKDCADEGTVPDAKTVKGIEADWEKVRK